MSAETKHGSMPEPLPDPATGPPIRTDVSLTLGFAGLALGLAALAVVMHRPVPHRIVDWGPVAALPKWLGSLLPHDLTLARLTLGVTFVVLVVAYLALLRALRGALSGRLTLPIIGSGALLLSGIPALAPYHFSGDVFAYMMYGRVSAVHHDNPMTTAPESFPGDAFLPLMAPEYLDTPSVYGPAWNAASHGLTVLAEVLGGSPDTYQLLYRAVCVAGFLASVWAVWSLLGRWRPTAQVQGTVLYAWSPLTLVELSSIHNDFVMLGLIGVALVLAARGQHSAAMVILSTAVLVKWIAIVVVLAVALQSAGQSNDWKMATRRVLCDAGLFLSVTLVFVLGFGDVVGSLSSPFNGEVDGVINSLAELGAVTTVQMAPLAGTAISTAQAVLIMETASKTLASVVLIVVAARAFRDPNLHAAVGTAATGLLAITLVAPRLWPWYALWSLMLAPLASRSTRAVAVGLSVTTLLIYVMSPVREGRVFWTAGLPLWVVGGALMTLVWSRRGRPMAHEAQAKRT